MNQKQGTPSSTTQIDKFKEAAKALETDDREEAFDTTVKKVAKVPPPPSAKPRN